MYVFILFYSLFIHFYHHIFTLFLTLTQSIIHYTKNRRTSSHYYYYYYIHFYPQPHLPSPSHLPHPLPPMKVYFKQRQKSHLVKHYHQEELKRLQKKITEIKHRKKGLLPSSDKENSLPILTPRYQLTVLRQMEIKDQNDRLSSRIAQTKLKDSEYFKKILKEKQRINNMQLKEKHQEELQIIKLIYSTDQHQSVNGSFIHQDKLTKRAKTQRLNRKQKKPSGDLE